MAMSPKERREPVPVQLSTYKQGNVAKSTRGIGMGAISSNCHACLGGV